MAQKHETCDKCGKLCVEKDNWLRGPLEGRYEWLCGSCARQEEMAWPLKWKRQGEDPR
jgi:hypothetical protein